MPSSLLGKMSEDLLLPKENLEYLIRSAPYRYKVYQIQKRSGTGMRTIAQPAKEIKRLQYWVMNNIFPKMDIHPSAVGYVVGKNIRNNCEPHTDKPYLLKLDFKDFFPSIKGDDFINYAQKNKLPIDENDLERLVKVLFWCQTRQSVLKLSIGAPSSPYLSNAIMYEFDSKITSFCLKKEVAYTRYADDMTFSMHEKKMRGIVYHMVLSVLDQLPYPKLEINNNKIIFASKAHRRMITGLILSNDGTVSIGREKKRCIRAQIHHFIKGSLSEHDRIKLRGMLAFVHDIEPTFVGRMEQRYGEDILKNI